MKEVHPDLLVGGLSESWVFHGSKISATKTVHTKLIGARRGDAEYIVAERPHHLILNWVDGPKHLYDWSGPDLFNRCLDFISREIIQGPVLVRCDQGVSRSPTLAMLWLAKRARILIDDPFDAAKSFRHLYPGFQPGGIFDYVVDHWSEIR